MENPGISSLSIIIMLHVQLKACALCAVKSSENKINATSGKKAIVQEENSFVGQKSPDCLLSQANDIGHIALQF